LQSLSCVIDALATAETSRGGTKRIGETKMKNERRNQYHTRAGILKLLSVEEAASVRIPETASRLGHGDEYIDLRHLEQGVLRAEGAAIPMGRVLPRKAVDGDTWTKIVDQLVAFQRATLN
jgi:hypothetical protein